jgi:hypothetical protein
MQHLDLITESVIRDGIENLLNNLDEQLTDIFGEFLAAYLSTKYGQEEINRLKEYLKNTPISVVFAFADVDANMPCVSINLISDTEDTSKAGLSDFADELDEDIEPQLIVPSFAIDSYDALSGKITCTVANPNLAAVRVNNLFVDADGGEFKILGPIYNVTGNKSFYIAKSQTVNITSGHIQSIIDFSRTNIKYSPSNEQLLLGIHSENASLTKWLYHIIKYILLSRKADLMARGADLSTYSGSDFQMDLPLLPDRVRSRFLTVSALLEHSWRAEEVTLIDSVAQDANSKVRIERKADEFPREDEDTLTVGTILEE